MIITYTVETKKKIEQIKKENNYTNLYLNEHISYKTLKKVIDKMDILEVLREAKAHN